MNKKHFFIILIIAFSSIYSFAQPEDATIYFKDGDSIPGYAFIKHNEINFRVSMESEDDFWDYEMVDKVEFETFFGPKIYKYIKLNEFDKPVLLELVTEGEISMYRQRSTSWILDSDFPQNNFPNNRQVTKVTNFLIRKNDDYPSCLNCGIINKWKKRTMDFVIDCSSLVKKIKTNELREIHLQEIVEYYNDFCTDY
ncbi:hypothetical protein LG651_15325 [Tamlana sp. 62-3]|uniref:Uncharacterized protein n=1 Tax=Neotamlana sargassicola TaxID=2883125 RepID=A0A9X1IBK5_9FLAO|nr:hypothetical protein [Tamlana sargassicola]MCB4809626.1 hypothetical protein [Tamlana sargassicola]